MVYIYIYILQTHQGLHMIDPWYNQQIKYLQTLLGEPANNTQTAMLIQISTEQLKLEIGLPETFKDSNSWQIYSNF